MPDIVRLCASGAGPPCTSVNVRLVGLAEMVPAFTVRVTVTNAGLFPALGVVEITTTVPVYVPCASLEPSTLTEMLPGVAPEGDTVSQFTEPLAYAEAA